MAPMALVVLLWKQNMAPMALVVLLWKQNMAPKALVVLLWKQNMAPMALVVKCRQLAVKTSGKNSINQTYMKLRVFYKMYLP